MRARTLCLILACMGLAACGIPLESEPEVLVLEIEDPPEIRQPDPEDLAAVSIYLVRDEALVQVTRDLSSSATAAEIIASLLDGLTRPEERADLRTSIPPGTRLLGVEQNGPLIRLDLSREFASVGGEEELLAVAQIVLTATSVEGVELVVFELGGIRTDVPVASGALSVDPVGATDYTSLLAP